MTWHRLCSSVKSVFFLKEVDVLSLMVSEISFQLMHSDFQLRLTFGLKLPLKISYLKESSRTHRLWLVPASLPRSPVLPAILLYLSHINTPWELDSHP